MYFNWLRLNYFYLLVAALLGLFMRADIGSFFSLPYKNLLHAHSHIAFLGWVYPTIFILLINSFLGKDKLPRFKWQLILTQISIVAMLVAFLLQGYGLYSIFFSSLFQFLNYWFIVSFLSALKKETDVSPIPKILVKIALWSLFLSTFGPWALGGIIASGLGKSDLYNMAIYFYLHFQYNGWILFALFALFFKQINISGETKGIKKASHFLTYMAYALIPGYCLSLLNTYNSAWNFSLAALSAILQLQALYFFIRFLLLNKQEQLYIITNWPLKVLSYFVLLALIVKIILQLLSIIPSLTELAFNNHNIIIAFLHLIMLGIVTGYLLIQLIQNNLLRIDTLLSKAGLILFLTAFMVLEIILGFQFTGFIIYAYKNSMIIFTAILLLGLILMFPGLKKRR